MGWRHVEMENVTDASLIVERSKADPRTSTLGSGVCHERLTTGNARRLDRPLSCDGNRESLTSAVVPAAASGVSDEHSGWDPTATNTKLNLRIFETSGPRWSERVARRHNGQCGVGVRGRLGSSVGASVFLGACSRGGTVERPDGVLERAGDDDGPRIVGVVSEAFGGSLVTGDIEQRAGAVHRDGYPTPGR